jgi:hypothetical protein
VEAARTHRAGSGPARLVRAWRTLPHESRLAAFASLGLFVTLFLPWYQVTLIASAKTKLESASASITGWGAFSFVEAAVLLVAAAVLILLFQRAEGRAFHLPGGDGGVITVAGVWTCALIVWRIFDKQGATTNGPSATTSGVEWGIFFALAAAAFLAYSGSRIRSAHRPEPPLPGEDQAPAGSSAAATAVLLPRSRPGAAERPRRRARPPIPDPPVTRGERAPAPDRRPRRRTRATDLFEPVVPEDPPTMRLSRIKPSTVDAKDLMARPPATDDDATSPLGEDATSPLGEDATSPLGEDATLPLGEDATLPLGEDATLPVGEDATLPMGDDATLPIDRH